VVPSSATIRGWSNPLTFGDLKVGESVRVRGTTSGGVLTATEVFVEKGAK
jgi:hypothetical protein